MLVVAASQALVIVELGLVLAALAGALAWLGKRAKAVDPGVMRTILWPEEFAEYGHLAKAEAPASYFVREIRWATLPPYAEGDELKLDVMKDIKHVDVGDRDADIWSMRRHRSRRGPMPAVGADAWIAGWRAARERRPIRVSVSVDDEPFCPAFFGTAGRVAMSFAASAKQDGGRDDARITAGELLGHLTELRRVGRWPEQIASVDFENEPRARATVAGRTRDDIRDFGVGLGIAGDRQGVLHVRMKMRERARVGVLGDFG